MKKFVIVDIDGTVAYTGDRKSYLQNTPKDWDSFFFYVYEDKPITELIQLVKVLCNFYDIIFCTGRPEWCRGLTVNWIFNNFDGWMININYRLLMRERNDTRHDTIVKLELIRREGIFLDDIAFVMEDRDCMVKAYRDIGLIVLQTCENNT